MKIKTNYVIFTALLFCTCGREKGYTITMTDKYIETSFSLINGLQIDELRVDSFSKDNTPYVFYLKESYQLARGFAKPGEKTDYLDHLLFFNQPRKGYRWRNDSAWGAFNINIVNYKYRGNIAKREFADSSYQKNYDVHPEKFKPGAWYLIDFVQDKSHHEFLHVDTTGGVRDFKFYRLKE